MTISNKPPRHIAIVMDGNGRWAKQRGLPRVAGHKVGSEIVKELIKACVKRGIEALTLFAFSSENWQRPADEVNYLMKLFLTALQRNLKSLHKNNIKICIIGDYLQLDKKLQAKIAEAQELTANNTGLRLNIAVNYSGRWDILQMTQRIAAEVKSGRLEAEGIDYAKLQSMLCLHDLPEPELFIRTSGEQRISNFLLWQLAYTELYFTDILWPDFHEEQLEIALKEFANRNRRFGKIC
jgi:undecaprenyl diphosphate synthase